MRTGRGIPNLGGARGGIGFWRADKSSGKIAIPEGPQAQIEHSDAPVLNDRDARRRDPRTAENIAAHEALLAPRRWVRP